MRQALLALGVGLALAITAAVAPARAADPDTKKVCIDADTQGQALRLGGKLADARAAFKACLDPRCPEIVRTDCNERMDELSRVQPTLVIEAKDGRGADLSAVTVYVDGVKVADALGGEGLPMDPGPHDLRFETAGASPVTRHVILREGDHARREAVVFGGGAEPAIASTSTTGTTGTTSTTTTTTLTDAPASGEDPGHGRRVGAIAMGAGGLAVLGAGIVFGLVAKNDWDKAQRDCNGVCLANSEPQKERVHALTFGDLSTVGFIVGPALLAGGAVLYFTAPKKTESGGTTAELGLSPSLGGAVIHGTF